MNKPVKDGKDQEGDKTSFQEQKKREADELIQGGDQQTAKPKTRKQRKPKAEKAQESAEEFANEGKFFVGMIEQGRAVIGIPNPLPEPLRIGFVTGYISLSQKYGNIAGRWVPELIFGAAVVAIIADSVRELKAAKIAKKEKEAGEKEAQEGA